ncbi:Uncharacterised protein [Streptococcus pneumoniae]|nr:Uncharacterised protein [Streptococcus pneumoniae]
MVLTGTKAWAKAVLKGAGIKRVMVDKRSTRLIVCKKMNR